MQNCIKHSSALLLYKNLQKGEKYYGWSGFLIW